EVLQESLVTLPGRSRLRHCLDHRVPAIAQCGEGRTLALFLELDDLSPSPMDRAERCEEQLPAARIVRDSESRRCGATVGHDSLHEHGTHDPIAQVVV